MANKKANVGRYDNYDYDDEVKAFGNGGYEILKGRMVEIPPHVLSQLDEACYYLQRAKDCRAVLKRTGLTATNARGADVPHPLTKIEKDAINMFYKLIGGLMLTPSTEDKARKVDKSEDNRVIDALING